MIPFDRPPVVDPRDSTERATPEPRIIVRDETDIRVLILALSLFSAHTHTEALARQAEDLTEVLASLPRGTNYSSRLAPAVEGTHALPERG